MWNVEGVLLKFEAISCDIEVLGLLVVLVLFVHMNFHLFFLFN